MFETPGFTDVLQRVIELVAFQLFDLLIRVKTHEIFQWHNRNGHFSTSLPRLYGEFEPISRLIFFDISFHILIKNRDSINVHVRFAFIRI